MNDLEKALAAALDAAPCVCGEPTLGVVHRADGPCYLPEQAPPAEQGECKAKPCAVPEGYALVHVDRMLAACLPGGSSCDPQRVADAIREYVAAQAPPAAVRSVPVRSMMK